MQLNYKQQIKCCCRGQRNVQKRKTGSKAWVTWVTLLPFYPDLHEGQNSIEWHLKLVYSLLLSLNSFSLFLSLCFSSHCITLAFVLARLFHFTKYYCVCYVASWSTFFLEEWNTRRLKWGKVVVFNLSLNMPCVAWKQVYTEKESWVRVLITVAIEFCSSEATTKWAAGPKLIFVLLVTTNKFNWRTLLGW